MAYGNTNVPGAAATTSHSGAMSAADKRSLETLKSLVPYTLMEKTVSGNPVTFGDGSASPVRNLSVTLTPTQSGSGDPSPDNVRPISGISSVSVTRSRKNLLNVFAFGSTIPASGGTVTVNRDASITVQRTHEEPGAGIQTGIPLKTVAPSLVPGNTYTLSATGYSTNYMHLAGSGTSWQYGTALTITQNHLNAKINFYNSSENPITISQLQIEAGSESTAYEPYQGASVNIPLVDSNNNPLTVYGGTLDVTTGELTVTHIKKRLADFAWHCYFTREADALSRYVFYNYDWSSGEVPKMPGTLLSSIYKTVDYNTRPATLSFPCVTEWIGPSSGVRVICIYDERGTGGTFAEKVAALKQAMGDETVIYELETPVTYQLAPQQLSTLYGYNTVSTDAGSVNVTYRADPSLAYREMESNFTNVILSLGAGI